MHFYCEKKLLAARKRRRHWGTLTPQGAEDVKHTGGSGVALG